MQFEADKLVPEEQREWLRCDVSSDASEVVICLATRNMKATAVRRGINEPLYMDATHGLQKYGLKLVTVHVKDEESKGMIARCSRICSQYLQRANDGNHVGQTTRPILQACSLSGVCTTSDITNSYKSSAANDGTSLLTHISAGKPVLWAVVRHESSKVYQILLDDLKTACQGLIPPGRVFKPSCILVDNSDAEINASRYDLYEGTGIMIICTVHTTKL
jgi:hypothetical protein